MDTGDNKQSEGTDKAGKAEKSTAVSATRSNRQKIPLAQRRRARRLILQALYQWLLAEGDPQEIAKQFEQDTEGKVDWIFFREVFLQIPSQIQQLDEHLAPMLDRERDALDPIERALLYQGTYELAFRIDVPYRVVINECVELAKQFGATDGHKYVNGVLDKLAAVLRPIELAAKS